VAKVFCLQAIADGNQCIQIMSWGWQYTGWVKKSKLLILSEYVNKARVQIAVAILSGNSLRQTVHTHCAPVHQAAKLVAALLRVAGVTADLAESNGSSLLPGLWVTSPAGWLPRTGISSGTLRSVIEYGLPLPFYVNKTEKIGWTWTNTNSYRENKALPDIFSWNIFTYLNYFIVLCLNILWLKAVNEITAGPTRTSFAKFIKVCSI